MSLYVRVQNSFYTHKKTIRLRAAIGDDAYWVPPRLWAYAADNKWNDEIFNGCTAEEIAMFIGYSGDATGMLRALLAVGFLDADPLRLHDWDEHNGYHSENHEKAKHAAKVRWSLKEPDLNRPEEKGIEGSIAPSMLEACSSVFNAWNETADNLKLPKCLLLSDKRRRLLEARWRTKYFRENWKAALAKITDSSFCKGVNDRGWRATFDWFITTDAVVKIMEGRYENRTGHSSNGHVRGQPAPAVKGSSPVNGF